MQLPCEPALAAGAGAATCPLPPLLYVAAAAAAVAVYHTCCCTLLHVTHIHPLHSVHTTKHLSRLWLHLCCCADPSAIFIRKQALVLNLEGLKLLISRWVGVIFRCWLTSSSC